MRRASVVGPIILIGIGVLFLARNLHPELPLFDFLSQYWPFILIAWGALRLVEILYWAMNRKPLPVNGVAGGEWVLIIFLCLIGSGVYAARHSSWFPDGRLRIGGIEMFGEAFDYPLATQKKPAPKNARIVIESFRGSARVSGVDGTDQVTVSGRKSIRAMQQADANSADQSTPLEVVVNGDQVIVRTNQDRVTNNPSRISEDLEISVPKGVSVEAIGRYGDFDVSDLAGNVEITSDNAGVRLQNIGGSVRVDTRRSDIVRAVNVKGTVELKGRGTDVELQDIASQVTITATYSGTVQLRNLAKAIRFEAERTAFAAEAIPGQVRMSLSDMTASNVIGPVRLNSRSKDIQLSDFTQGLDIAVDRGDIELRPGKGPLGKMDVHTRSGDIDLALPDRARVQLTATTDRGEVTNDFDSSLASHSEGRGATLKSSVSDGARVVLTTGSGSITVRKASDETAQAPAAPKAPEAPEAPRAPTSLKPVEQ